MMSPKLIIARTITYLLHPIWIVFVGFMLLLNSGFYFSVMPFGAKKYILLVVFLTTFLLPLMSFALLQFYFRTNPRPDPVQVRSLPLLVCSLFYYLGYYFLGRVQVFPVFKFILLAAILIIVLLMFISLRWNISSHMAGIGGLIGAYLALAFRLEANISLLLGLMVLLAGLLGSSLLVQKKNSGLQIYGGFFLGFFVNFLLLMFI